CSLLVGRRIHDPRLSTWKGDTRLAHFQPASLWRQRPGERVMSEFVDPGSGSFRNSGFGSLHSEAHRAPDYGRLAWAPFGRWFAKRLPAGSAVRRNSAGQPVLHECPNSRLTRGRHWRAQQTTLGGRGYVGQPVRGRYDWPCTKVLSGWSFSPLL